MHIFMLAASLRQESFNKKLIQLAARLVTEKGHKVNLNDFNGFNAPLYNADIQTGQGFPEAVVHFAECLNRNDALILASPEYNFSTPGTLKNLIDWVSRLTPMPWKAKRILLLSASPSLVGGNRGLWHTRVPLEACGAFVFPDMFSLASAHEAFTSDGQLKDSKLQGRLQSLLAEFLQLVGRLSSN